MKKTIALSTTSVEYLLRTSRRSRRLRLTIHYDGRVVVTAPVQAGQELVEAFLRQKKDWILEKLERFRHMPKPLILKIGRGGFARHQAAALHIAYERLAYFNAHYQLPFGEVKIKNTKSRWGSCSRKGSLHFNYKIALLPAHLADYIIVHELCHVAEFNHSSSFWRKVAETVPEYKRYRGELRRVVAV